MKDIGDFLTEKQVLEGKRMILTKELNILLNEFWKEINLLILKYGTLY